ncbi:MAG: hypothetical protein M3O74_13715 [Pseudomonadota bacterium]|nr:hypothetical protein [Pseudomonadota bacterium]
MKWDLNVIAVVISVVSVALLFLVRWYSSRTLLRSPSGYSMEIKLDTDRLVIKDGPLPAGAEASIAEAIAAMKKGQGDPTVLRQQVDRAVEKERARRTAEIERELKELEEHQPEWMKSDREARPGAFRDFSTAPGAPTPPAPASPASSSEPLNYSRRSFNGRAAMQGFLTIVVLTSALYVIVVKADSDAGAKNWAFGVVGTLLGFWLKR